jgi:hypothetical protein
VPKTIAVKPARNPVVIIPIFTVSAGIPVGITRGINLGPDRRPIKRTIHTAFRFGALACRRLPITLAANKPIRLRQFSRVPM